MNADIHALSGAYAIDALSDAERAGFEAHLATCAACRDEVDSLREAATLLGQTAAVSPPPAVREAVLAGIAGIRPLPPVAAASTSPTGEAEFIPLRRRWLTGLVAAAAVVLALATGALVWHPWTDGTQASLADQVLAAADATHARATVDGAEVTLVRSASLGKAVVVTDDLPVLPEDQVYELWLQNPAGEFVPAGLLPRSTTQKFLLLGDAGDATGAGITIEPAGGSPSPTTEPLALFAFDSTA